MTNPKWAPPFDNADYQRGFEEGQRHSAPSAETNRRLHELADAVKVIVEMNASIKVMEERTRTILEKFGDYDKKIEKLDTRMGDVEKTQTGLATKVSIGATLAATIAGAIINRIL
jgi:hypothetical protein